MSGLEGGLAANVHLPWNILPLSAAKGGVHSEVSWQTRQNDIAIITIDGPLTGCSIKKQFHDNNCFRKRLAHDV